MTTQQHTSHHPPSGQGHATQPVFGPGGLATEVVELVAVEGRVSLTGEVWTDEAIFGRLGMWVR